MKPPTRADLDQLAAMLRRRPHTAREIADHFGCARPTAYEWIRRLRAKGARVLELRGLRDTRRTGPPATAYEIR